MSATVLGIVKDGRAIPNEPLPEGAQVEIHVTHQVPGVPKELRDELEAWDRASAKALDLVERQANGEQDAAG